MTVASDKAAEDRFRRQVEGALSDAWLSEREWRALRDSVSASGLAEDRARAIYEEVAQYLLAARIHESLADGRFSPDEERDLAALAADLRIEFTPGEETTAMFDDARHAWRLALDSAPVTDGDASPTTTRKGAAAAFAAVLARIWKRPRA